VPYAGPMKYQGVVDRVNNCVSQLRASPRWGRVVQRHLTIVTYTGRRSGRTFSTPVGFQQNGSIVTIGVMMPERKNWWRNFLGAGGPLTLQLDGAERSGHAVARRDAKGRVAVTVHLDA
jgi:hypothetical protein